ncbi:hypothetical protein [Peptostreptococcus faecalis]|uniref:hypothetical protein n=1 Tax=Peptostreptococcus faecalis TaxID=2045015 RepID=UPI000C7E6E83|nr:hypothetical protein [Peptostreptococcus faecalis]
MKIISKTYNWITRDKEGFVFLHKEKPVKESGVWCVGDDNGFLLTTDLFITNFPSIQWRDRYATKIIRLKNI